MAAKKKTHKKKVSNKRTTKKSAPKKKSAAKRPVRRKKNVRSESSVRRDTTAPAGRTSEVNSGMVTQGRRGLGPSSGGQSGDIQGLPRGEDVDSESVEELSEEGQSFEAEVVSGVENAPNADQGEIRTREVLEDDIPKEYRETRENE